MSKNTGTSELINYFYLGVNGAVGIGGSLTVDTIANATTDTDKFLVSDNGIIKYRTASELLSDLGSLSGSGTTNYLTKFTGSSSIGNSLIFDNGTNVLIGTTTAPAAVVGVSFPLSVTSAATTRIRIDSTQAVPNSGFGLYANSVQKWSVAMFGTDSDFTIYNDALLSSAILVKGATSNVLIGYGTATADAGIKLDVNGTGRFTGALSGTTVNLSNTYIDTINITSTAAGTTKGHIGQFADSLYISNNYFFNGSQSFDDTSKANSSIELAAGSIFLKTGVANTVPGTKLTIASTGAATFSSNVNLGTNANGADTALLNIKQAGTSYNNGIYLERGGERNGYHMYIGGALDALTFRRNYFGTQSDVMSLTRDGNVGIGTDAPNSKFEIRGSTSSPQFRISRSEQTNQGLTIQAGGGVTVFDSYEGTDTVFGSYTFNSTKGASIVTRMRIDGSGNVGIGTTNPSTTLTVSNESHGVGIAYMGGSSLPAIAGLFTDTSSGQQGYGSLLIKSRTDYAGYSINFFTAASANTPVERMRITSGGSVQINYNPGGGDVYFRDTTNGAVMFYLIPATYVGTAPFNSNRFVAANSSNISFETAGAERLRITSIGNVLVGTTTDTGAKLNVGGSYQAYPVSIEAMAGGGQLALTRSGAVAEFYMGGTTGAGTQLYVRSGGAGGVRLDSGATSWVSASDIRLKDIKKSIENAVLSLSTFQTVYFSWKDSADKKLHLGLIAQEVEEVFPELVSESSIDKMKGVKYTDLIPVLVAAIKELKVQIEALKTSNE